ncbi:hypothetical protein SLS62_000615 [Diatrype stigma]|uniref:Xylanolytic transcriptional activator regulatory domain-containing protein n=1 Tax=Diatrype stigma TaxID=117547 RepID=A0AAN9V3S6_9PEZI
MPNTRSLEANSGATFLRRLALRLDPHSAPRLHTFAWNAFLGARKSGGYVPISPPPPPITRVLSLTTMQSLALVYFQKVDPTYGFIDRRDIERYIEHRWAGANADAAAEPMRDAVLCGIAALGCLFSHVQPTKAELDLAESARLILERAISEIPTTTSITAWLLRVVYLRISDTHHTAWMASCMLMHMVEAAGLHREPSSSSSCSDSILLPSPPQGAVDQELRRRLVAVSQHLNMWTSFDMGRARVLLSNATVATPSRRPGDHTAELMELLPYSAELDPQKSPSGPELEAALLEVTARAHSTPPSVLAQCNLALCLCRRLQSMGGASFAAGGGGGSSRVLDPVLALCSRGVRAARDILDARAPWHHLANVPFQIVCLLLAIDSDSSTPCLKDAVSCLRDVARVYDTDAIQEALRMASSLIALHIRWKEKCTAALRDVLVTLPDIPSGGGGGGGGGNGPTQALGIWSDNAQWLNGLSEDLSTLPCFDIDEFMVPAFFGD